MAQFYWNGSAADWETTNWQDALGSPLAGIPQDGDTIHIASGTVTVALFDQEEVASNQTIFLGSSGQSGVPTLDTTDQAFLGTTIQESGDYLNAVWIARGETSFQSKLNVTGANSSLVLSAISDGGAPANPGVFVIQNGGLVNVGEEGTLDFTQGTLRVDGLLNIQGGATFESGTVLTGDGTVDLGDGGSLDIRGATDRGTIDFSGRNATLQIDDAADFKSHIVGFATGDTINLTGIVANDWSYDENQNILMLYDGLKLVDKISINYATNFSATQNPFIVTTDGTNTVVQAGGANIVKAALPVTIFGFLGEQISLATILTEAFGSTAHFDTVYVADDDANFLVNRHFSYWTAHLNQQAPSEWSVRSTPDSENDLGAPVTDFANTYLTIGNDIRPSAVIEIPVVSANGAVTEYLEYTITVVDPSLELAPAASHTEPTPQDIVNSAYAFDAQYGDRVIKDATEDCESIARDVAGAAGATRGGNVINPNTSPRETANLNQPGGFWRIAYDGGDVANPTTDWFSLVQPGDIVRLGWGKTQDQFGNEVGIKGGHTTTVLAVNLDRDDPSQSTITVYDNADKGSTIGIHTMTVTKEDATNPAYITIYRLTTDGRYLIGTHSGNEIVHDTIYDDDVELVGAGDTIYGGAGNEMIRGFSADLQGLTLVDGHVGDFFQFKDATAVTPTYDQATGALTVAYTLAGNAHGSAAIQLTPGMAAAFVTAAATDGTGETVTIDQLPMLQNVPASVAVAHGPAVILAPTLTVTDVHGTTLASATVHVSAGTFTAHDDVLSVSAGGLAGTSIVANYNAATETLTLSGTDTLAHYQQALEHVAFETGNFAADRAQIIEWQVSDGAAANNLSDLATTAISMPKPQASDFSGDGHSDILWQNDNGTPAVWLMNGTAVRQFGSPLPNPGPSWHAKDAADFNGDGMADILWQNDSGTPAVWLMNGTGLAAMGPALPNPGPTWHVKAAADFNGDGKADILWQNDDGAPAVWLMNGTGVASMGPALSNLGGKTWHVIDAADFDGDGKADILWQNENGTAAIWLMNGTAPSAIGPALANPGPNWHVQAAGDFNGDGKADILWQNTNGQAAIWLMDGNNLIASSNVGFNPGPAWQVHGIGDFNGDGKADIAWQNTDGTAEVWLMDGFNVVAGSNVSFDPGANWHVVPPHHDVLV